MNYFLGTNEEEYQREFKFAYLKKMKDFCYKNENDDQIIYDFSQHQPDKLILLEKLYQPIERKK